jgi:hydrophobic/amphiphilic exporter-1 (mainly G- bacteria), HAE1 family
VSLPRFGVTKPVPVNLLMVTFLIAGLYAAGTLRREFFPEMAPDSASVTLIYPGATPEEIEESLVLKIEDRLERLDKVSKLTTTIGEGGGGIIVEFREGIRDVYRATDEVQRAIDQLQDLPEQAERIRVTEFEPRLPVIMVTLHGDVDEDILKRGVRRIRDDLRSLPGMGEIVEGGVRGYEIRIDVSAEGMLQHGVSLPQISDAVRRWMQEVPGGSVRTDIGTINVRAIGVEERSEEIRSIVLRSEPNGRSLRVRDVATVTQTFVDEQVSRRFNGQPGSSLTVFKTTGQDVVAMAEMVRAYVAGRKGEDIRRTVRERVFNSPRLDAYRLGLNTPNPLPPNTTLSTHSDLARFVEGRLALLLNNAMYGAILVFGTLLLFLNWRVAVWVGIGLVTAITGTLVFMQVLDITLNLLTMFGLIVVLGLLVDDAIVVAENIQSRHDRGEASLVAAIKGTEQVGWPVVATVLTSIVAFLPLAFLRGRIGDLLGALPWVVACALMMSLVEALLILPSHMGHSLVHRDKLKEGRRKSRFQRFEEWRDHFILGVVVPRYAQFLERILEYRYISFTAAIAALIVSLGLVAGGRVGYTFLESSDAETIIIDIRMPIGTSIDRTEEVVSRFEAAAIAQPETQTISAIVGQSADIDTGQIDANASHLAQMFVELHPVELREANAGRSSQRIIQAIRETVSTVEDAERIRFSEITGGPGGPDISVRVRGNDIRRIRSAVSELRSMLSEFAGVVDIADDETLGQREIQIRVRPEAAAAGFTTSDVAMQIRGALFGIDAHVFAADREDIDVRVRLDEATRRNLRAVENLWVISPDGGSVPLIEIAELREGASYATIKRVDRMRAVTLTADTVPEVSPESIMPLLDLDGVRARYSDLVIELAGRQEQQRDAFRSLPIGFLAAMIGIYAILAWLFSSYTQPLAVMMAIPFGVIGVIFGHWLLGYDLTFLSMIGFVALSGVVVNGSLIFVQFYNTQREPPLSLSLREALVAAGRARLRPIVLTTITTVLGLTPLMLETSFQARFLIPMAISIAFGLLGATVIILIVLPCLMVIVDDLKAAAHYLWYGRSRSDSRAGAGFRVDESG